MVWGPSKGNTQRKYLPPEIEVVKPPFENPPFEGIGRKGFLGFPSNPNIRFLDLDVCRSNPSWSTGFRLLLVRETPQVNFSE